MLEHCSHIRIDAKKGALDLTEHAVAATCVRQDDGGTQRGLGEV